MKQLEYLLTDTDDLGILTITINQPKKLNALSEPLMKELDAVFAKAFNDDAVKAIILTGAGEKAFVAGADISEFKQLNGKSAIDKATYGQQLFRKIETGHKVVVAAVNGFALGGGCELAMACHFRIASENAKFGQPEVNLGLLPGYGGTQRLTQLIGRGRATELLLSADMISADEAYRMGLVNYVVPQEELIEKSKAVLKKITRKSSINIAQILKCVDAVANPEQDGYKLEALAFGECFDTEDTTEGITAFLEKRKPVFKGK